LQAFLKVTVFWVSEFSLKKIFFQSLFASGFANDWRTMAEADCVISQIEAHQ
jgi:hypothetical protein